MHKSTILDELTRELKMRRDVWQNFRSATGPVFIKNAHQGYYDRLKFLSEILPEIYPHEWEDLCARRERTQMKITAEEQRGRAACMTLFPE